MSSENTLYTLVEGKGHDRSFYDRVIRNSDIRDEWDHRIFLVEQIELECEGGSSAGGKQAAYRLFSLYSGDDTLVQHNESATGVICFMLDRDFDHLSGTEVASPHIVYTQSADVESEILINGDIRSAIGSVYSLDQAAVEKIMEEIEDPVGHLADIWRQWLLLLVLVHMNKLDTVFPVRKGSDINGNGAHRYGPVVQEIYNRRLAEIKNDLEREWGAEADARFEKGVEYVDQTFAACRGFHLIKGKWVEAFIWNWMNSKKHDHIFRSSVRLHEVTACCFQALKYSGSWMEYYDAKLRSICGLETSAPSSSSSPRLPMSG